MTKTRIEWTDEVWNPVTGCTKVSQGCKHCYAERMWDRLSAPGMPYAGRAFADVRTHPDRLDQPLRWKRPRRVFVNSMSDLFHEAVPDEFLDQVFAAMALAPQHTFPLLTKRPARMCQYLSDDDLEDRLTDLWRGGDPDREAWNLMLPLENVWLGVSVEDQDTADERIPLLLQTPAAIRWISAEPLLGPLSLDPWLHEMRDPDGFLRHAGGALDWVVVGGESGPHARPMHPDWARSLRDACVEAGVPFFMKQLSGKNGRAIKDIAVFPADLKIREYPR